MKDKDIIKMLKKEVTPIVPNVYDKVNSMAVTPQKNTKLMIEKERPIKTQTRPKFMLAMACVMVLVLGAMVAIPFIISSNDGNTNRIQYETHEENVENEDQASE